MLCLTVLAVGPAAFSAQDDTKSGPQVGQKLPGPFEPFNATGPYTGRPHCLVCERGLHPTVLIFARDPGEPDGPVMKLIKAVDDAAVKHRASDLGGFAVFLSDDVQNVDSRRALVKRLQDLADAVKLQQVVLALDRSAGPRDYNINKETDVTVLVYNKHTVAANRPFAKDALNDEAIKSVLADVEKMLPMKRPGKK
jgi:hypothetical protein